VCRRGSQKKHGAQDDQALGRSRGGFSTKIHGVCDALGNPLGFILTGGQKADCVQAIPLMQGLHFKALLADKGYDANAIIEYVEAQGGVAVIPPKSTRLVQRAYDKELYQERHKIECTFGFLKHYRRLFSRFEKIAARFSAFLHFVAALQWLK
jgi:transposase